MTDFRPADAPTLPPLAASLLGLLLRHGLTGLASILAAGGVLGADGNDQLQFITLSTAFVLYAAGLGWSLVSKVITRQKFLAALATPAPAPRLLFVAPVTTVGTIPASVHDTGGQP